MKPCFLLISILILLPVAVISSAQESQPLTAGEVVERMAQSDARRQTLTQGYAGMRRYVLDNNSMHKHAEMVVRVTGDSDGTKHFEVVSEGGWKAAQKHVLHKMLESESQMSRPEARVKARLCPENYEFQMVALESVANRPAYAIDVNPKRHDQYLFSGRIWVDAEDYALVRADGSPSKNPSFWTKRVHFVHTYQKTGPVWVPLCTESVTDARIFGRTDLSIEYFDYKPNGAQNGDALTARGFGHQ